MYACQETTDESNGLVNLIIVDSNALTSATLFLTLATLYFYIDRY